MILREYVMSIIGSHIFYFTLQVPSGEQTGFGSPQDSLVQTHFAAFPSPEQTGVVFGQTSFESPQMHLPSTHLLLSPLHLSQGSNEKKQD